MLQSRLAHIGIALLVSLVNNAVSNADILLRRMQHNDDNIICRDLLQIITSKFV
jgi:hypothetical protein